MIYETVLLALSIPIGFFIAWIARDELVVGRKWFKLLFLISVILAGLFFFMKISYLSLTFIFIAVVSFISIIKSKDKSWTRRRI